MRRLRRPAGPAAAALAQRRSSADGPWSLYFLKMPSLIVGGLGLLTAVTFLLASGGRASLGALIGTVIVVGFFTISAWAVALLGEANAKLALPAAIGALLLLCLLLGVVLLTLPTNGAVDTVVMAMTVAVGTVMWLTSQVIVVLRTPLMYVDPQPRSAGHKAAGEGESPQPPGGAGHRR